jgi:hypothetical protein
MPRWLIEPLQRVDFLEHLRAPQTLQKAQRGQAQRDGHRVRVDDGQLPLLALDRCPGVLRIEVGVPREVRRSVDQVGSHVLLGVADRVPAAPAAPPPLSLAVGVLNGRAPDLKDVPPCLNLHGSPALTSLALSPIAGETRGYDHSCVPVAYPVACLEQFHGAPGFSAPTKCSTPARNTSGLSVMDSATKNMVPRSNRDMGRSKTLSRSIPANPGLPTQASRSRLRGVSTSL